MSVLSRRDAIVVFLAFALAYFFSTLIRAITGTLSPTLTQEFALNARDLGLLAGGYFLGFSLVQLPMGAWLDRHGPKKVVLSFLSVAVLGCLAFALADSFFNLLLARVLTGVGVGACLMAPLTGYRRWFHATTQLRANSWMLMTGSLGMVASTLPVQWVMPLVGWRPLFFGLAFMLLLSMLVIAAKVPAWQVQPQTAVVPATYAEIWRHPYFRKMTPIGFFGYGGLVAVQTLWAVPWMIKVAGYTPAQATSGLFWINVAMLFTFWSWGMINPWLARRGYTAERLIRWGLPLTFAVLAVIALAGARLQMGAVWMLTLFCMTCSVVPLAQSAVGMAFPPAAAGRALSAYNLVLFSGVFAVQWGIGLVVDGFKGLGWTEAAAFQGALAAYLVCYIGAYVYLLRAKSHNPAT